MNHAPTEPNVKGIDGQQGRDSSRPYGSRMLKVSMGNKAVIHHAPTKPNVKGIAGQQGRDSSRPYGAE